jgi:allantoate deiminase
MNLRRDALVAAAECITAVERNAKAHSEVVGTVGRIEASPGAINVIPGKVVFTVDIRAPKDDLRLACVAAVQRDIRDIGKQRNIDVEIQSLQEFGVTQCAPWLMAQMDRAVAAEGLKVRRLPSGAGHDGMAIRAIADIAMLFVRCKGGISHNPAEAISAEDAGAGAQVLLQFITRFEQNN